MIRKINITKWDYGDNNPADPEQNWEEDDEKTNE